MKKLIFIAGAAVGFVVGSKMGREPYEKLEATARQYAEDPRVQEKFGQAKEGAANFAKDATETVKTKAPEVAGAAKEKAQNFSHRKDDADSATYRTTPSDVAGGDAQVGEDPLAS